MLKILNIGLFFFASSVLFGQELNHSIKKYSEDSKLEVVNHLSEIDKEERVALYIEEEFIGDLSMYRTLNPDEIRSVDINKEAFKLHNVNFDGKIIISYKDDYQPEYILIKDFILEQTDTENPIVVQIDEEVLDLDYAICKLDKADILKLILEEIPTSKKGRNIVLAKFITKTPANITKANTIRIK
jgi:hypothetical protein